MDTLLVMNIILIILSCSLIATIILIIFDINHPSRCKHCGTRMDKYFDAEEDAEVYQCPCCGRSYIVK